MRLLILALAFPALAQPALAREHSRHHARASAHSHHAHFQHVSRHHARIWMARRHRAPAVAFAGERYGAFEDQQMEYRPAPFAPSVLADRSFERRERFFASSIARPSVAPVERPFVSSFAQRRFAQRLERRAGAPVHEASHGALDAMISRHAQTNGLPESLVHRVVIRESRYNPRAVGRGGAMGLMQIKYSTARAMGYSGSPSGLLDPETNLTYAVRYLAGAYRAAGGSPGGAVSNYAHGYYASARRAGFSAYARPGESASYAMALPIEGAGYTRRRAARRQ